jgi:chromosome partitioning protein
MTRTLVIANPKGGVGKSTAVMNIAVALAERDRRVLLIDLDPQAGLTAAFGIDPYGVPRGTYAVLMHGEALWDQTLRPVRDRIALVPASLDLAAAEIRLAGVEDRARRLTEALQSVDWPADLILIDTPPSLGILAVNGLVAADEVVIPVQCQYLAMRGVRSLIDTVVRLKNSLNPALQLGGLFATRYCPESHHSREVLGELKTVFGSKLFKTTVYQDEIVAEAPVAGLSILEYSSRHLIAQQYRALAEEIVDGRPDT